MMRVALIAAIGKSGQIGLEGKLPWHNPEDLKWFQQMTAGKIMIAGYNTYQSIKHLDNTHGRLLLLDRNGSPDPDMYSPFTREEIMIVGGAKTYKKWLPFVNRYYISRIDYDGPADSYFYQNSII